MVYVLNADVASVSRYSANNPRYFEPRVRQVERLVADVGRGPRRRAFGVEVVVVVTCGGDDIDFAVGDAQDVVSQRLHLFRVGVAVATAVHQDAVRLDRVTPLAWVSAPQSIGSLPNDST